jgi:hypothetical protein
MNKSDLITKDESTSIGQTAWSRPTDKQGIKKITASETQENAST